MRVRWADRWRKYRRLYALIGMNLFFGMQNPITRLLQRAPHLGVQGSFNAWGQAALAKRRQQHSQWRKNSLPARCVQ